MYKLVFSLSPFQMQGILTRKVVPANNSCLFTSINCCMNEGRLDLESAPSMRTIIAGAVTDQSDLYNEVVLGKPNREYCSWILKGESWGGAIEISILNKYYAVEIDVVGEIRGITFSHLTQMWEVRGKLGSRRSCGCMYFCCLVTLMGAPWSWIVDICHLDTNELGLGKKLLYHFVSIFNS